ncbi:MAG: hypothetical protein ACLFUJ_11255 [Phycisphaerae bacterium]
MKLAREFRPLSQKQQQDLLGKTHAAARTGDYEKFKSSNTFDGWTGREIHDI